MSFLIYFDESNKLDSPNKKYSYYGAYGGSLGTMYGITKNVKNIYKLLKTKSEMHFNTYDSSEYVKKYFQVLNYVIDQEIAMNILIVNNADATKSADRMSIDTTGLRDLFYTKIPERLFYGVTRNLNGIQDVRIKVDDATEYRTLKVYQKLKEQMNAHSAYRNKGYNVSSVLGKKSNYSIPLQIIDTFMGIIVFLMEESYYEDSISSKAKSDLIYRFLIEKDNITKFQNQITLYKWEGNEEKMVPLPISEYLSSFLTYKTQYDIQELAKFQKIIIENSAENETHAVKMKGYRVKMGYKNREANTLMGYLSQLETGDRNFYLRPFMNVVAMKKEKLIQEDKVSKIYQFKDIHDNKYKEGFKVGKILITHNEGKQRIEKAPGILDYEYLINNVKAKDKTFKTTICTEEYWKRKVNTTCGEIRIFLDDQLTLEEKITSLQEPLEIEIDVENISKLRIQVTGLMIGVINPIFIKATY